MGLNKVVGFSTARLLKEKGFEQKIISFDYYLPNGNQVNFKYVADNKNYRDYSFYSPTIAEVVMWLYEKHGIWITVTSISQESWQCHMTKKGDRLGKLYLEDFYTPTEAYEAAIEYTLNNLL